MSTEGSESQASTVAGPAVQGKQFAAALVLLTKVLGYAPADLCKGTAHNSAEVALLMF